MKFFLKEEDRQQYIKEKLKFMISVSSIVRVKSLPKDISFVTWSFGSEAENHYYYEVTATDNSVIVCRVTTFFEIWIVKSRFYEQTNMGFRRMSL